MSTIALTEDTFEETVTKPGITLVDWWASWCGPVSNRAGLRLLLRLLLPRTAHRAQGRPGSPVAYGGRKFPAAGH